MARQQQLTSALIFFPSDGRTLEPEPWQRQTERVADMLSQPPLAVVRSSRAVFLLERTKVQMATETCSDPESLMLFNRSPSPFVVSGSSKQNSSIEVLQ
ncbi:hypothetical protein MRB53_006919 [Persea americana]|uniref:Uncharacterized protein n=1 Tax=Persea americana TaxID=3435 RepID=A0ACC2MIF9_PERAE|nr:hypothetical protein MRB53_006919 [Persea americana]